jgi:hypothetical protein
VSLWPETKAQGAIPSTTVNLSGSWGPGSEILLRLDSQERECANPPGTLGAGYQGVAMAGDPGTQSVHILRGSWGLGSEVFPRDTQEDGVQSLGIQAVATAGDQGTCSAKKTAKKRECAGGIGVRVGRLLSLRHRNSYGDPGGWDLRCCHGLRPGNIQRTKLPWVLRGRLPRCFPGEETQGERVRTSTGGPGAWDPRCCHGRPHRKIECANPPGALGAGTRGPRKTACENPPGLLRAGIRGAAAPREPGTYSA